MDDILVHGKNKNEHESAIEGDIATVRKSRNHS